MFEKKSNVLGNHYLVQFYVSLLHCWLRWLYFFHFRKLCITLSVCFVVDHESFKDVLKRCLKNCVPLDVLGSSENILLEQEYSRSIYYPSLIHQLVQIVPFSSIVFRRWKDTLLCFRCCCFNYELRLRAFVLLNQRIVRANRNINWITKFQVFFLNWWFSEIE